MISRVLHFIIFNSSRQKCNDLTWKKGFFLLQVTLKLVAFVIETFRCFAEIRDSWKQLQVFFTVHRHGRVYIKMLYSWAVLSYHESTKGLILCTLENGHNLLEFFVVSKMKYY
jgi:hypothetical protein